MAVNKISVRIGGPAGYGIMNSGLMFSKACTRYGLHVFDYIEYPSLIRGGHNTYHIRAEDEPIASQIKGVDILMALDNETIERHADELNDSSIIIYDPKSVNPSSQENLVKKGNLCPIPLKELVSVVKGADIMRNTVAIGAILGFLDYDLKLFNKIIEDTFKTKKSNIVSINIEAINEGYNYVREHYSNHQQFKLKRVTDSPKRMLITGNDAVALGAVQAGMKFYSAYPMTPASNILHDLAAWQDDHDLVVKHAEDEISVINMAIGAGFAGVRSMVATSGGGFALMTESLSLAAMTETPVVIVEVMRSGPATGLPTWTEQSDLQFALHAGHGDFPRFVLAPGDIEEAFWLTTEAFNIAERFQTPVIILSDKYLGESHKSAEFFDIKKVKIDRGKLLKRAPPNYERYSWSDDGVSPRTIPGMKDGLFLANSDEHKPHGYSTEEIDLRNMQMHKRMHKEEEYAKEMIQPTLFGDKDGDVTIIGWGSTKGPIRDAMKWLRKDGFKVNHLHLTHIAPFPSETVKEVLNSAKRTIIIENNYTGQMELLIKEKTLLEIDNNMRRFDGRPFYPEDIYNTVSHLCQGGDSE